jgi:putative FmdB family regulatory protein
MTYTYYCQFCGHNFDRNLSIENRNRPLIENCPHCNSKDTVTRSFETGGILYDGIKSIQTRAREAAGSDFNDVLKRIHKGAGQKSQIETN